MQNVSRHLHPAFTLTLNVFNKGLNNGERVVEGIPVLGIRDIADFNIYFQIQFV